MAQTAAPNRAVGDAVRFSLRGSDDVHECLEWMSGMGCHDVGRGADQQHRLNVLLGVERKLLQKRVDRMSVEHEQPIAAIRRGLRDLRGSNAAGCARLVLDDDDGAQPPVLAQNSIWRD